MCRCSFLSDTGPGVIQKYMALLKSLRTDRLGVRDTEHTVSTPFYLLRDIYFEQVAQYVCSEVGVLRVAILLVMVYPFLHAYELSFTTGTTGVGRFETVFAS